MNRIAIPGVDDVAPVAAAVAGGDPRQRPQRPAAGERALGGGAAPELGDQRAEREEGEREQGQRQRL